MEEEKQRLVKMKFLHDVFFFVSLRRLAKRWSRGGKMKLYLQVFNIKQLVYTIGK